MHSSVCNNSLKLLAIDNYIEGLDVYQLSQIVRKSTHTISRNVKRYEEESTHERQGNSTCGREPQIDVSLGSHIQYFYDKIPSLYHDECVEFPNQQFATRLSQYHILRHLKKNWIYLESSLQ
ncbi:hypothetical protein SAICODRAFT_150066 [Saitoella complicata NRRL Y-17804]|uniref:uncharacterized protein n=1 Tax=Saitoella complicata (strain BCRC 22490 / CBS 7301 / JCM 7358 / NBRC 10748 / NRRL Y-17804) TaxID=698492 RepID=UPI000866F087|nr:uncharacterized protein SAICODRAFT_150066 [Saitoella complicata NRRL Y-17804]ODQ55681.1 hypothetical protein SAICODRAFT_150066 [Saitoella complicata NRRL Y-17804]